MTRAAGVIAAVGVLVAVFGALGANYFNAVEFGLAGIALILSAVSIQMTVLIKTEKAQVKALEERNAREGSWGHYEPR